MPSSDTLLLSGSSDRKVLFWDTETGQNTISLDLPDVVTSLSMSSDYSYLAVGCLTGCHLFHNRSLSLFNVLQRQDDIYCVAFSPDSRYIATASRDVTIWDLGYGSSRIRPLKGHEVRLK